MLKIREVKTGQNLKNIEKPQQNSRIFFGQYGKRAYQSSNMLNRKIFCLELRSAPWNQEVWATRNRGKGCRGEIRRKMPEKIGRGAP